ESQDGSARTRIRDAAIAGLATGSAEAGPRDYRSLTSADKDQFQLIVSADCGSQTRGFGQEDNEWRHRVFNHNSHGHDFVWAAQRGVFLQSELFPYLQDHINALVSMGSKPIPVSDIPA